MNILITGCSRGIGYETVLEISQTGNHKIIGIARSSESLKQLEKMSFKSTFIGIPYDLNKIFSNADILFNQIKTHIDHADILINNAGFLIRKHFDSYLRNEIEEIFSTNLFAPAELIRLLLPIMGGKKSTHIVNISSMSGFQGSKKFSGLSWYGSSKAAIACLTESLSEELKNDNIYLNCLAIGAVETEMLKTAFPGYKAPVTAKEMGKFIAEFALSGHKLFNGKILPVAILNP